jgi:hypothetical protein
MSDAYTSTVVLGYGMEVKESGGDYNEVMMQLGVWCSASLKRMWSLCNGDSGKVKPLVGVAAVGHEWVVHISWKLQLGGETVT